MYKAALLFALAPMVFAQAPARVVRATGTASVSFRPDQAKLNIGVVTQGATAQAASDENATRADAVIKAVSAVAGQAASIRTIGYSINPNSRNAPGQPPQIAGYTATNTIEVTMNDPGAAGRVIDAGTRAGASTFSRLQFLLANPEPARQQALSAAARQARAHAEAIATGLGGRTGNVRSAGEVTVYSPQVRQGDFSATLPVLDATSPILRAVLDPLPPANLDVSATVSIEVELQ